MAMMYRDVYGDIKAEKEKEETEADRIFNKYAYLFDGHSLKSKKASDKYNLQEQKDDAVEEVLTTDLSDDEMNVIYRKYKIARDMNVESQEEI
jgi:hypothetical protein